MFMVISWLTLVTIYTLSLTYLWNWSFILTYGIAVQFLDWVTVLGTRESDREIRNSKSKNHFYYIYSNMHIDASYTFIFICIYINTHSHISTLTRAGENNRGISKNKQKLRVRSESFWYKLWWSDLWETKQNKPLVWKSPPGCHWKSMTVPCHALINLSVQFPIGQGLDPYKLALLFHTNIFIYM